ncbi:MAG: hypothetical protein JXJ04_19845 [Spirochaetales bacterium]|nr:hypothetical protein [Spirochaetales bacterium]
MKCSLKKSKNMLFIIIIIFSSLIVSTPTFGSTPPDASDYTLNKIPAAFVDISETGYLLTLGNQQGISGIPLGFEISFYGRSYDTITITSNGYMTFSNLVSQMNTPFPSAQLPDNIIAPFWDDLNPSLSPAGGVYFETKGTAPNRIFIVQWDNVPLVSDPLSRLTFQAQLFEKNNEVQFHYLEMVDGSGQSISGPARGSSASIGMENAGGTRGTEVSFNQDGIVSGNTAFSFTLAGNAFESGRLLGDLDNDGDITILDQSILTDLIIEANSPHLSTDLLLADTAPNYPSEERAFGDGIIDESDHDTIFQVMMGRQELNPVISGTSLFIAPPGESIILYGSGFDCEASLNTVIFTDTEGNSIHVIPDQLFGNCEALVVTVPGGLDFITSVRTERNTLLSNSIPFFLENSPVITSMTPDGGQPGDIIRIKGYEFGFAPEDNLVHFNGIPATITGVNTLNYPRELQVRVPVNVTTGPVTLTVGGNISNEVLFTHDGPPIVTIISPATGSEVTGPVEITGTAFDYHLESYILDYAPVGESEYITLGTGTSSISNDVLGHFDPTMLLNGMYTIRLRATDSEGNTSTATALYRVKGDMKIGNFTLSFVDLEVPVAGMPITITRTYDSRDKGKGDFGYGWSLGINSVKVETNGIIGQGWDETVHPGPISNFCIEAAREHIVSITFPDGTLYEFKPVLSPSCQIAQIDAVHINYVPLPGTDAALTTGYDSFNPGYYNVLVLYGNWDGIHLVDFNFNDYNPTLYFLTLPDGREFAVHIHNGIQRITDLNGNVLTMSPNGITSINESVPDSSKGVTFERDSEGRITGIFDPEGNGMSYAYDESGDLTGFTDREENTTHYKYHPDFPHYLEEIIDPLGRSPVKNEYYDDGRLKSHTDANGNIITYNHDVEGRQEIVTDRLGNVQVLRFDERGNVIREVQADGTVIDRQFDARNNTIYESEAYDPNNPPDPVPAMLSEYDDRDNLLWKENALGHRTIYTYNDRDQVLTAREPGGTWTIFEYDDKGNILSMTVRDGAEDGPIVNQRINTYDNRGNLSTNTVVVSGEEYISHYTYDPYGNVINEIDAEGYETSFTYDLNGNTLTRTTSRQVYTLSDNGIIPSGTELLTTRSEYDKMGRELKTFEPGDPEDVYIGIVYDALGRKIESYDKLGRKTSYEYDRYESGIRWDKVIYPNGTYEEYGYDAENHQIRYRDPGGRLISYEYDEMGRLFRTIKPAASDGEPQRIVENSYDSAGRPTLILDPLGNSTEYSYNVAGYRTMIRQYKDDEPVAVMFGYDSNGNQTSITDPKGNIIQYEYNAAHNRVKTSFPPALPGEETTFIEATYDELGRKITEKDQAGKITHYTYDKSNRLTRVTQTLNNDEVFSTCEYDESGNCISRTDAENRTTWFIYNKQGKEIACILPAVDGISSIERKTYYVDGSLATYTDFMGRITTYEYDDNTGFLVKKSFDNGESVTYTYTASGQCASVEDSRGITTYNYNDCKELTHITYPDGNELEYDYDLNGNRISLTTTIDNIKLSTTYTYDTLNRMSSVTDPLGHQYIYDYDKNGNQAYISYPNNTRTDYQYDNLNHLIRIETKNTLAAANIQQYDFILGPTGNRSQIIENQGTQAERTLQYTYNDLYQLTGERVNDNNNALIYEKTFTYDTVGNRLQQSTIRGANAPTGITQGDIIYNYDARDRLLLEGSLNYSWDENGNLLSRIGDSTYTWDYENRLISVENIDGTLIEYSYDTQNNRLQTRTTLPGQVTETVNYLIDTSGGLSHVVAEVDDNNNLLAYYVRGNSLLSVLRPVNEDWTIRFYNTDGNNSVRALTDETGTITDTYSYTAFGEMIEHIGIDPQPYAFTGEPFDPRIGLQYHRARWMDPLTGRWVSRDKWEGDLYDQTSLHRYIYTGDDPQNKYDPTGYFSFTSLTTVSGMMNVINSLSTLQLVGTILYKTGNVLYKLATDEKYAIEEAFEDITEIGFSACTSYFLNRFSPRITASVFRYVGKFGWIKLGNVANVNGRLAEHHIANLYKMIRNERSIPGTSRIPDFLDKYFLREIKNVSKLAWSGRTKSQLIAFANYCRQTIPPPKFVLHVRTDTNVSAKVFQELEKRFGPGSQGVLWDIVKDLPKSLRVVP